MHWYRIMITIHNYKTLIIDQVLNNLVLARYCFSHYILKHFRLTTNYASSRVLYCSRASELQIFTLFSLPLQWAHVYIFSYTWVSKSSIDTCQYQYCKYWLQYRYHIGTAPRQMHTDTDTDTHRHRHRQTQTHTDRQTHTHTDTHTHRHTT